MTPSEISNKIYLRYKNNFGLIQYFQDLQLPPYAVVRVSSFTPTETCREAMGYGFAEAVPLLPHGIPFESLEDALPF